MAAFDTPWTTSMGSEYNDHAGSSNADANIGPAASADPQPTVAAFSPNQSAAAEQRRSRGASVIVHQKTPLLMATPPQVTRALAYSHPFILPLNRFVGLLSWTTGDPWESFLFVASFWFLVLYGDIAMRYAGPVVLVIIIILAMYNRRYSPLSSNAWSGEKDKTRKRAASGSSKKGQRQSKSLDEILDSLHLFTSRCNILLEPFLQLVEFLSTQTTATAATTRPALTTLFIRILMFTPFWIFLSLPPLRVITTQRIVLAVGTFALSYHSRPARVCRTLLWRSRTVRSLTTLLTGLEFPSASGKVSLSLSTSLSESARLAAANAALSTKSGAKPAVRFTFALHENQRRWLGLGWTSSLLSYERQAWTDEHLNTCNDPENFVLPSTEAETSKWRWAPGSEWTVEGANGDKEKSAKRIGGGGGGDESGWIYYDNKWRDGRKVDGWGRYTRRRKWFREAELVDANEIDTPVENGDFDTNSATEVDFADASSIDSKEARKRGWFRRKGRMSSEKKSMSSINEDGTSLISAAGSADSKQSRDDPEDDHHTPVYYRQREWEREIDEGIVEGLG
ncbi:Pex24p-domain-containing protein [Polychaeton citri CBS 116435]|uniref:Pex24p-domain-containing protein n=1 Tax=Polychaeton citri CBS 116435 TaxID=1314669 RepID=A0A9P4QD82_9PEZI|nr:Pex24p-domain-containing protein [Polychaeton citri CBS 116435]